MTAKNRPPAAEGRWAGRWATGLAGAALVCGSASEATPEWATGAAVVVMVAEIVRDHRQSKLPFLTCAIAAAAAALTAPEALTREAALVLAATAAAVSAAAWRKRLSRNRRRTMRRRRRNDRRPAPAPRRAKPGP